MTQPKSNQPPSKPMKLGDIISAIRTAKGNAVEIAKNINNLKYPKKK